jgi:hypothetical protein
MVQRELAHANICDNWSRIETYFKEYLLYHNVLTEVPGTVQSWIIVPGL